MNLDTLNPAIYRRAAEMALSRDWCCCPAISWACRGTAACSPDYKVALAGFFKPRGLSFGLAWWPNGFHSFDRGSRVIALLLMAEIVADAKREARACRGKARRA